MDFRVLGPLEVAGDTGPLVLGGTKQRSLLAMLLLHANQVVSTDQLIDALWGASPPATCGKSIQVYVSRLRKELGGERLATRPPGYVLHVEPSELDLARFEQLATDAHGAAPEDAARKLREALALWRGPPLSDLAFEAFAQAEIARLDELRVAVHEERIDADLALGRHAELVGELEALIVSYPLRERLRGQLMLALYRSERQAEALEAYQEARRELADGLGLEPSERLKRLEQAVLRHDQELDLRDHAPPEAPGRAILIVPRALSGLDALLGLAEPLAVAPPHELIMAGIVAAEELGAASAALAERRDELLVKDVVARIAAFSSPHRGDDIVRLAGQESVDLLLVDAGASPLDDEVRVVLENASCDVALLAEAGGSLRAGPIVVPFGAGEHDWAALQLGAWVAHATDAPLRLIGSAGDNREEDRDASRLLADASLIVQRTAGIVAEPLLASPGRRGVASLAAGAGLLVVGLSERWRQEGLGRVRAELAAAPPAPTLFVRRGSRPGGLAPPEARTSFGWSLTVAS
jgi:DNA-binding SARP family transcriptional activator